MLKLQWTGISKSHVSDTSMTLKQYQGHQTYSDSVDPEQSSNYLKFERFHFNGVCGKAYVCFFFFFSLSSNEERVSWCFELQTQKLKSHLVRTQSLNVLPLKPTVRKYIAIHATLTARDFFFAYFYPSCPFTCIFPKTSPAFSCVGCG